MNRFVIPHDYQLQNARGINKEYILWKSIEALLPITTEAELIAFEEKLVGDGYYYQALVNNFTV